MELLHSYRHKIKTVEELIWLVGSSIHSKKLVLCHGVFDLVHPGHLRHLLYAKSKADILIVSITADIYVQKANYRPFVPQELRALNLAALEMVDYVVINHAPDPIELINTLKPDFFAKGYEYQSSGFSSATQKEVEAVQSYGGEVIFTPGDIVYSSSAIIESEPPDLKFDKLHALMAAENITFDDIRAAISGFHGISVHVVGDTIVDSLTHTTKLNSLNKTPTPSVRFNKREDFIGGAAIVASHLAAAGAQVTFTTVMGDDQMRDFALEQLSSRGVRVNAYIDPTRPTTHKNAFLCDGYRLLKIDIVDNRPINEKVFRYILTQITNSAANALVFSDFRHGIFTSRSIPDMLACSSEEVLWIADSQVASRWGNILDFKNCDLVTPNESEARFALADQDTGVLPLVGKLQRATKSKAAIMKLGAYGVVVCHALNGKQRFCAIDSFARKVVDPVGAGDALLAYATLALTESSSPVLAAILGSFAAAIECEVEGNMPVSADEILQRIKEIEQCG
jgi:rfaE bifunctional protein kinase chain/domain/rfaE bifunctional protein nucleotidyltransferase chain/domain